MVMYYRRIWQKLLICCVMIQVVVSVETADGSQKLDVSSAESISKPSSERTQIPELNTISKEGHTFVTENKPEEVPIVSNTERDHLKSEDPLEEVYRECKNNLSCTEQRMIALLDLLDTKKSIPLFDHQVTLEKTSEAVEEVTEMNADARPSEALLSRVDSYLRSHSIRVQIPKIKNDIPEILGRLLPENSVDIRLGTLATQEATEGRGKLKKLILPFILGLKLKFAILLPIFISTIALISFKGLWAGLAAMLVSGALGLKALLQDKDGNGSPSTRFTLGVVKPHLVPEIYHSDHLSGWSRSVPPPVDHPYRTESYYRGEHPYRGYYPSSWERPMAAAAAAK